MSKRGVAILGRFLYLGRQSGDHSRLGGEAHKERYSQTTPQALKPFRQIPTTFWEVWLWNGSVENTVFQ